MSEILAVCAETEVSAILLGDFESLVIDVEGKIRLALEPWRTEVQVGLWCLYPEHPRQSHL